MKTSKTAQAVQKLKDGDLKGALSIFSIFNYNFTREERRIMRIVDYIGQSIKLVSK